MTSSENPKYSIAVSAIVVALVGFDWVSYMLEEWGWVPYRDIGLALTFGLVLGIFGVALLADWMLARIGVQKNMRSGFWVAVVIGPYMTMAAFATLHHPIQSQLIGIISAIAFFAASFWLENLADLRKNSRRGI